MNNIHLTTKEQNELSGDVMFPEHVIEEGATFFQCCSEAPAILRVWQGTGHQDVLISQSKIAMQIAIDRGFIVPIGESCFSAAFKGTKTFPAKGVRCGDWLVKGGGLHSVKSTKHIVENVCPDGSFSVRIESDKKDETYTVIV